MDNPYDDKHRVPNYNHFDSRYPEFFNPNGDNFFVERTVNTPKVQSKVIEPSKTLNIPSNNECEKNNI